MLHSSVHFWCTHPQFNAPLCQPGQWQLCTCPELLLLTYVLLDSWPAGGNLTVAPWLMRTRAHNAHGRLWGTQNMRVQQLWRPQAVRSQAVQTFRLSAGKHIYCQAMGWARQASAAQRGRAWLGHQRLQTASSCRGRSLAGGHLTQC